MIVIDSVRLREHKLFLLRWTFSYGMQFNFTFRYQPHWCLAPRLVVKQYQRYDSSRIGTTCHRENDPNKPTPDENRGLVMSEEPNVVLFKNRLERGEVPIWSRPGCNRVALI